jgi:hypothetical protein
MEDRSNSQLQIRWRSLEVSKSRSDEPSVIIVTIRIHALMFLVGSEFQRFSGRSAKIVRRFHGIRLGQPKYLLFVGSNLPSICLLERHNQRMMSVWPTRGFRDRDVRDDYAASLAGHLAAAFVRRLVVDDKIENETPSISRKYIPRN